MQSGYSSFLTANGVCGLWIFSLLCDTECGTDFSCNGAEGVSVDKLPRDKAYLTFSDGG